MMAQTQNSERSEINIEQYRGCFLGLAVGDAYGARYEGGPLERLLWRLLGKTKQGLMRYTDDTQMSIDLAQSYLEHQCINQDQLAQQFAESYRWSRGYGPSAAKLLKGIQSGTPWQQLNRAKYPEGSLGNGAAMRAPIIALCHPHNDPTLKAWVQQSAEITHAHPLAVEGAYLIALCCCLALQKQPVESVMRVLLNQSDSEVYQQKLNSCLNLLAEQAPKQINHTAIRQLLGNGILAAESTVTAIYFGLGYRDQSFENLLHAVAKLGGDTDTIGAMAGAIWGCYNGDNAVQALSGKVEDNTLITQLAEQLFQLQN